jgi:hypothetical protein
MATLTLAIYEQPEGFGFIHYFFENFSRRTGCRLSEVAQYACLPSHSGLLQSFHLIQPLYDSTTPRI